MIATTENICALYFNNRNLVVYDIYAITNICVHVPDRSADSIGVADLGIPLDTSQVAPHLSDHINQIILIKPERLLTVGSCLSLL